MTLDDVEAALAPLSKAGRAEVKAAAKAMELHGTAGKSSRAVVGMIRRKILDRRGSAQREAMMTGRDDADLDIL